ncbi:MAG: 6-phosphogluconolactonase [Candidatus Aminicenantes bacterium]|nr:6-phosphogluconolactonase [Candidatus Aminicenantes bacterium]
MEEPLKPEVNIFPNLEKASRSLAEKISGEAKEALEKQVRFAWALSGGSTPRQLYTHIANEYKNKIEWSAVHLFWGDERWVPENHPDSNFAMAYETMISKVPLPPPNINRVISEIQTPERAAESYEKVLREFFNDSDEETFPTFDVMLLGVGEDGHTASLFSGSSALEEKRHWVVAVDAPPSCSPKKRITLTLPLINRSRAVFFLVSGSEKSRVLRSILEEPYKARRNYPAAMVKARKKLAWYVDEDAYHG